jgi:hypothetical protein
VLRPLALRWTPVRVPRAAEVLSGLLEEGGPCGEDSYCRLQAALVLHMSGIPRGLEWLLGNVEPGFEGEPPLAAVARIIARRLEESRLDCEERAERDLVIADGVHDLWR